MKILMNLYLKKISGIEEDLKPLTNYRFIQMLMKFLKLHFLTEIMVLYTLL